ncbi:MAG: hypothetical protein ACK5QC_11865 [Bacteroidota bacterium]|jgi:hypothetical protein
MLKSSSYQTPANRLLMLVGLLVGLCLVTFQIIGTNLGYYPGDLVDGRLNLYFLEHVYSYICGNVSSFWDVPFMYPEKNVLAYSDNLIGSSPVYILFRLLQFNSHHSYQLWYVSVTSINYLCAYYFLNYLFKNSQAAILGAFVFAFSLALQSQLTHSQTFPRYAIPMAFLAALKFQENLKLKYLLYALLWVVYEIYCVVYLGLMLAIPLGIYLALILFNAIFIEKKIQLNLRWLLKLSGTGLFILSLLILLMFNYLKRRNHAEYAHYLSVVDSVPTLTSYFYSQFGSLLWNSLSRIGETTKAWWDHQLFSGLITTVSYLIGFALVAWQLIKNKFNIFKLDHTFQLMFVGLILFFIYLRVQHHSPYIAVYYLPGFSAMRSMTRIINIELLFFSICVAFIYLRFNSSNVLKNNILFYSIFTLLIIDNYFKPEYAHRSEVTSSLNRLKALDKVCEKLPPNSIISYEPQFIDIKEAKALHLDAMLAAQKFKLHCLNGYTGNCLSAFKNFMNYPSTENRKTWLKENVLNADTLYVIRTSDLVEKIDLANYYQHNPVITKSEKIRKLIKDIEANEDLMKQIDVKAKKKNIPLKTMVIMDALWMYKQETHTPF